MRTKGSKNKSSKIEESKTEYLKRFYYITNGVEELHIWSHNRETHDQMTIYYGTGKLNNLMKEGSIAIKQFEKGHVRCCGCNTMQEYENIKNNRYKAGVYCNFCWNESNFKKHREKLLKEEIKQITQLNKNIKK